MISKRALVAMGCVTLLAGLSLAQSSWDQGGRWDQGWGWGRSRFPPKFPDSNSGHERGFTFCRVMYDSVRNERLGHGWNTDYPGSDINFMTRFSELTKARVNLEEDGEPHHVVVTLMDDELFEYPFIFMSDVGTVGFTPFEAERLRVYLLSGGFLYVDDFWGEAAWNHWSREIGKALPPDQYPIEDVALDDPIFRVFFDIRKVPQIPSIQYWRWSGGAGTSERGQETAEVHFRGIRDERGQLMVVMTHNTDIADGWEREAEDDEFFHLFSLDAYPVGINIVLYSMTH